MVFFLYATKVEKIRLSSLFLLPSFADNIMLVISSYRRQSSLLFYNVKCNSNKKYDKNAEKIPDSMILAFLVFFVCVLQSHI